MGGSSHSFPTHSFKFKQRYQNYDLYSDSHGIYAEKHIVPNNPKISPNEEMEVYYYRNKSNKPIVKVYNAEYAKADSLCSNDQNITVLSQYIPYRLSQTRNLNHGQGLYVLSETLYGFHQLYNRFGPFSISDDHIGFNKYGQVKIWHNPNFATNHLQKDSIILMSTTNPKNFDKRMIKRQEEEMVQDIWLALDDHCHFNYEFKNHVNEFRQINFITARNLVKQQIQKNNTYVPDHLLFQNKFKRSQYSSSNHSSKKHPLH